MTSKDLILCWPLLFPSIFPSVRVFFHETGLCIRWSKYWSFSFSIGPFNEDSGLIYFGMDWLDLLTVPGILESSPASQFESIRSLALGFPCGPTRTSLSLVAQSVISDSLRLSWTIARQAALSMGFSRQESWSGLPSPLTSLHDYHII